MIISALERGVVVKTECQEPDFDLSCDLLCVGAGSAGANVADSAARLGTDVILLEISENIGGMPVCGMVTSYYYGARGGSYEADDEKTDADVAFLSKGRHPDLRQISLTERLAESGARLLTRHNVIGLYMDGSRVVGARVFNGDRILNIKAKITVDATSDGHLIRMTDVKKQYGRAIGNSFVPFGVFLRYTKNGRIFSKNNDLGIMNHYDENDFTRKVIMAHASADKLLENVEYVNLASHTGIREGLSFEGEKVLRCEDVLLGKKPDKVLFHAYADLDRHGCERATEEEFFQNWWVISNVATVTVNISVPLGCIVPKGISGLVSAGRCMSFDTYMQSAVRMNSDMFRMGECIGVATAIAIRDGVELIDLNYEEYLSLVRKRGCFDGYADRDFCFDNKYSAYLTKMRSLGREPDPKYARLSPNDCVCEMIDFDFSKNMHLLKTDAPGVAIWSAFVASDKATVKEALVREMNEADDELYRYNCAIALGITEAPEALPTLREIVERRDCFFFTDNRRSNQFRSAVAVCLLGRLGGENELSLLYEILSDGEIDRDMYHTLEANYLYHTEPDRNFVYFQMLTHTCMAIYKIHRRLGLNMRALHSFFEKLFADDKIIRRTTDAKDGEPAHAEICDFIDHILRLTNT